MDKNKSIFIHRLYYNIYRIFLLIVEVTVKNTLLYKFENEKNQFENKFQLCVMAHTSHLDTLDISLKTIKKKPKLYFHSLAIKNGKYNVKSKN